MVRFVCMHCSQANKKRLQRLGMADDACVWFTAQAKEVEERSQEAVAQASREAAEYIVQKEEEVRLQLEEETAKAENVSA